MNNYSKLMIIDNIPVLQYEGVVKLIEEVCREQKMKILIPEIDIYLPHDSDQKTIGYCVVLYDGWEAPSVDQLSHSIVYEEEQIIEQAFDWKCEVCTLLNKDASVQCIACETPKPPNPFYPLKAKLEALNVQKK